VLNSVSTQIKGTTELNVKRTGLFHRVMVSAKFSQGTYYRANLAIATFLKTY